MVRAVGFKPTIALFSSLLIVALSVSDLLRLIAVWPKLSAPLKAAINAIIDSFDGSKGTVS